MKTVKETSDNTPDVTVSTQQTKHQQIHKTLLPQKSLLNHYNI